MAKKSGASGRKRAGVKRLQKGRPPAPGNSVLCEGRDSRADSGDEGSQSHASGIAPSLRQRHYIFAPTATVEQSSNYKNDGPWHQHCFTQATFASLSRTAIKQTKRKKEQRC